MSLSQCGRTERRQDDGRESQTKERNSTYLHHRPHYMEEQILMLMVEVAAGKAISGSIAGLQHASPVRHPLGQLPSYSKATAAPARRRLHTYGIKS
jgi:hypothetical protein